MNPAVEAEASRLALCTACVHPWLCARIPFGYPVNHNQSEAAQRSRRLGFNSRGQGEDTMRGRWSLAILGVILIVAGGVLAWLTQTSGGIIIQDIRFQGAKGNPMSALLYIPPNATAQT